jgi:hypothetical protein
MAQFESIPAPFLIPLAGTVFGTIMMMVLGYPLVRAWARRLERRDQPALPDDVNERLARIEAAVETIAIEVERISESQRFLTKLQADALGAGKPAQEQRR